MASTAKEGHVCPSCKGRMLNKQNEIVGLVVHKLLIEGLIPETSEFDVEEHHLSAYIRLYDSFRGKSDQSQKKSTRKRINYSYARKLAGLTLMKLKLQRGCKATLCKEGFVYLINNPAWPNHNKLGMTVDIDKRLASYQKYSPFRDYKVTNYDFVLDKRLVEKQVLNKFQLNIEKGEWISDIQGLDIMNFVRSFVPAEPSW